MLVCPGNAGYGAQMEEDVVIAPGRGAKDPQLSPSGILLVNPMEAAVAKAGSGGWRQHFLFNSQLYSSPANDLFWAGPAVGAPMAVMALEKLIALGARRVLVYGWCGSLQQGLQVGDILLPTWALSEEGTSGHYPVAGKPQSPVSFRSKIRDMLAAAEMGCGEGPVWTTDAPYRETRTKVRAYQEQGILAVDMEYSALCTVAAFRGIELAGVFLVSDEVWRDSWRPGFTDKKFKRKSRALLSLLLTGTWA